MGDLVRHRDRIDYHRARDARMARHVTEAIAAGTAPSKIVVVVGAAHAAAFVHDDCLAIAGLTFGGVKG